MVELVREYLGALLGWWWVLVPGLLAEALDLISTMSGKEVKIPQRRIVVILLAGLQVANFFVYREVRANVEQVRREGAKPSDIFEPLDDTVKRGVLRQLSTLKGTPGVVGVDCPNASPLKTRLCVEVRDILKEGGLLTGGPFFSMTLKDNSKSLPSFFVEPNVMILGNNQDQPFARALIEALAHFIRFHFDMELTPTRPEGRIDVSIDGDPLFLADGSVTFR
jgi:hypothetical protein